MRRSLTRREYWERENDRIVEKYSRLVGLYGGGHRSQDWGSRESQEVRFGVLCQIGVLKGASILDVGCGLGDLYRYLRDRGVEVEYTGYDLTPAMIAEARRRFPGQRWEVRDLLAEEEVGARFDYVMASGIFYLRQIEPQAYLEAMVRRMYAVCRRGVAFNSLSAAAGRREAGEFYAEPGAVLELCLRISSRVVLRHDYLPHDFTVYLYR